MRKDVHLAALRAASKVAFSMAFLAGCSSEGETDPNPTSGDQAISRARADGGTACAAKFTCEDLVKAAFPTPGSYPGTSVTVSPQVASCCHDLLAETHGFMANRWDCCANYAEDGGASIGSACTPWGPPVPPPMRRRATLADVA